MIATAQLVARLSGRLNLPQSVVRDKINHLVIAIDSRLVAGDSVVIRGFGTFYKSTYIRNSKACNQLVFRPSKDLLSE
ncbi:HU family DNA-binding protein [Thaumasiovibrio sp. DFM-14]|uniref:HU family DNA-binding protein n=1 Tax=Thaumasiovibrio sp. DFM-14 TaxID=3384792 RepID=UPI0039A1314E